MLKVDGSTIASVLWALEQEGVTEDELLCICDPKCKKRIARILKDFRRAQTRRQGNEPFGKLNIVDQFGNVIDGVGSRIEVKGQEFEVVGTKMRRFNFESYSLEDYEEGKVPSWIARVIENCGRYVSPQGYSFVHYPWFVGEDGCYTTLVLKEL